MKHLHRAWRAALAALLFCLPLSACRPSADIGNARTELVMNDPTRVVIEVLAGDPSHSLYDALSVFRENGQISFGGEGSREDFYLTSLGGLEADSGNFWAVYTTLGTWEGESYSNAEWGTWEYDGRTLASASYGLSGLPLVEGEWYALVWTAIEGA